MTDKKPSAEALEIARRMARELHPAPQLQKPYAVEEGALAIDALVAERTSALTAQKAAAWAELREIREAIHADPNEATADEVRRIFSVLTALTAENARLREALMRIDAMITTSEHYTMTKGTHDQAVQIARAALEVKP